MVEGRRFKVDKGTRLRAQGVRFRAKRTAEYRITNFELRRKEFYRLSSVICLHLTFDEHRGCLVYKYGFEGLRVQGLGLPFRRRAQFAICCESRTPEPQTHEPLNANPEIKKK
jgi:hypothetical protein